VGLAVDGTHDQREKGLSAVQLRRDLNLIDKLKDNVSIEADATANVQRRLELRDHEHNLMVGAYDAALAEMRTGCHSSGQTDRVSASWLIDYQMTG
jgi:hypothetical protein